MSWQSYIDTLLAADGSGTAPVAQAAICGVSSGQESVWAASPGFTVSVDEIKKLAGDRSNFGQTGVVIGGQKCRMLRDQMDTEEVYALQLKTAADAEGNSYNVCVGRSATAIVIAKGTKDANGGQVSSKVYGVVTHLRKSAM
ncbi:profilin-1 [Mugil cephalus]|uniref:profilin-1 n=1 Tax=Mugil cephalus TaxID=48193 RepID=UPI001FB844DE|nr:profilin-1 [Mugil cephalus]